MNNNKRYMQAEAGDLRKASKRSRFNVKTHPIPNIDTIKDLIEMSKSCKFYTGIDTTSLWKIEPHLRELDALIGMEKLKETVLYQILYFLQGLHRGKNEEYLHTVICGEPGVGKSLVASTIAKIYTQLGILSKDGSFKVARRSDLLANYLGQTSGKTLKFLQSCLGGVLFIDEAYSLAPRHNDRDSFAKECCDTINQFLSEHKSDFCCIIAGYKQDLEECFFAMNSGLMRRFPWWHTIDPYTNIQLAEIFMKLVKDSGWHTTFSNEILSSLIEKNKQYFKFNGGSMETYLTRCRMVHSKRVFSLGKHHRFVLNEEDLKNGLEFTKKHDNKPVKDKSPPTGMYL